MKEEHCGICKKTGVKLYRQEFVQHVNGHSYKSWWSICTSCATTRQLKRHYLKKSIHDLEEMRIKAEKRLSTLVNVLNSKLEAAKGEEQKEGKV